MIKKILLTITLLWVSLGLQAAPVSFVPHTGNLDIGFLDFTPKAWFAIFDFNEDPACDSGQPLQDCRFGNPLLVANTDRAVTTEKVDIEPSGPTDYNATNPLSNGSLPLLNSPGFILAATFDQGTSWWNPVSAQLVGTTLDNRNIYRVNYTGFDSNNQPRSVSTSLLIDPQVAVIPLPAAIWLFASGMFGLLAMARRRR